jgi:hypothetical protein
MAMEWAAGFTSRRIGRAGEQRGGAEQGAEQGADTDVNLRFCPPQGRAGR